MMFISMDVVAQGNFTTLCMRSMATLFLVSYPVRHLPIHKVHGNTLFGIIRHHYGYNINFPVHALSAITSNWPRSGMLPIPCPLLLHSNDGHLLITLEHRMYISSTGRHIFRRKKCCRRSLSCLSTNAFYCMLIGFSELDGSTFSIFHYS